ncbi:MAG: hypothetical protein LBQ24_02290 [Candidatus Peribacteria bacterium]|jgi:hypothetical protein|nr:hypothetical protein [Candidatus Peribacteria bacterium]
MKGKASIAQVKEKDSQPQFRLKICHISHIVAQTNQKDKVINNSFRKIF